MMKYIIEFEGFQLQNTFVFKEVVIYCLNTKHVEHFFVRSPPKMVLSATDQAIINYCERNLHKIKWSSGRQCMSYVKNLIKDFDVNTVVYTKGLQKSKLLQSMFKHLSVYDLEELGCPKFNKVISPNESVCPLPFHSRSVCCAHRKALAFAKFLESK